ncbi:hypothetical protein SRS16CHR_01790 [Variovorax sp. SRS16]|nr:hypothetical protein SRS16CHR_01790 [Variovorax sp. SRS16]
MGERAQAIITKQILRDCDLLVAIFWTRLGSPTGVAASGTVEEIEEHLGAGRPAMLYFSSAPAHPDSIDPVNYAALKAFKAQCRDRGLIHEYDDLAKFKADFGRHLAQTIIRNFPARTAVAPDSEDEPQWPAVATLSVDAHMLLDTAVREDGSVMKISTLGGTHVQAGRTTLTREGGGARDEARWIAAVTELIDNDLVEDRAGKGEVFFVTHHGYRIADALGSSDPKRPNEEVSPKFLATRYAPGDCAWVNKFDIFERQDEGWTHYPGPRTGGNAYRETPNGGQTLTEYLMVRPDARPVPMN